MIKYEINPGFDCLKDFVLNVHQLFPDLETTLQNSRNHVKVTEHKGIKLCIKSFGNHNPINRIVYSFIRPSKANRSFNYALKLLDLGVNTPDPVAFVEYYNSSRILQNSYSISVYLEHDLSLKHAFDFELSDRLELLSGFARFACNELHNNGILHKDLSASNVLIKNNPEGINEFYLIDLNRMRFRKNISFRKRMANLKRINGTAICLGTIAHFYSLEYRGDPVWGALQIAKDRISWMKYRRAKKGLKTSLKAIKNIFGLKPTVQHN
ncbi:MAG: hypothetical protein EA361_11920 [Bacteroidetes bacterium]|nr:MAG: hypothetical protein EA361_11920 [Bacteroidota bacterium]